MKNKLAFGIAALAFFSMQTVSAITIDLKQLSCSGLGLARGYTTINLLEDGKLNITSVKYFLTASDANVEIRDKRIAANGFVELDLRSPLFNANWKLVLTAPVGDGHFTTGEGTDVLSCRSRIEAFQ